MFSCQCFQLFVVQDPIIIHAVGYKVIVVAGNVYRAAVGQMTAAGQIHTHHRVAGLQQSEIDSRIGLCAAVGLHVCMLRTEQFLGSLDSNGLSFIYHIAAAVIPFSRITFRVFVGHHTSHGQQNRFRYHIFRCDQLQAIPLSFQFLSHHCTDFRIHAGQPHNRFVDTHFFLRCFIIFIRDKKSSP